MSLNKVMLIGNVGMDPEVRYLDNSQAKVARVRLATTERYTDRSGEARENTEWHTVTCWRRLADLVEKYVKKGSQIYVEGRLQTREWTDNSGAKRYTTEVNADNIQLLGRRSDNTGADNAAGGFAQGSNTYAQRTPAGFQPAAGNFSTQNQATTPAGPGGYQAPYQPNVPTAAAPAATPVVPDFGAGNDDDLPF